MLYAQGQALALDDVVDPGGDGLQADAGIVGRHAETVHAIAPCLLGGIAGGLQVAEQVAHIMPLRSFDHTNTQGQAMPMPIPVEPIHFHRVAQRFGQLGSQFFPAGGYHCGELHPANPCQIGSRGEPLVQLAGNLTQAGITRYRPGMAIDQAELVDVRHEEGRAAAGGQALRHCALETAPVEQPGQLVVAARMSDLPVKSSDNILKGTLNRAFVPDRGTADQ
ncbi:hypothetical protein D9M68_642890 [compost metagenome]